MAAFSNFPVAATVYSYLVTYYRALTAGTGYTVGDVIRETTQINTATGAPTGVKVWYNVDQDVAIAAAPLVADIEALDKNRIVLSAASLTVSNVAAGVSFAAPPADANYAEVHVWDADVVVTLDGTAPTATGTGFRQANGQTFELESRLEITQLKALRLGAVDAKLYVTYYRVYGDPGSN